MMMMILITLVVYIQYITMRVTVAGLPEHDHVDSFNDDDDDHFYDDDDDNFDHIDHININIDIANERSWRFVCTELECIHQQIRVTEFCHEEKLFVSLAWPSLYHLSLATNIFWHQMKSSSG